MTKGDYNAYIQKRLPRSRLWRNMFRAFWVGGTICCIGQILQYFWGLHLSREEAATASSICLILLGSLLTALGIYDNLARYAGAGTLVPITGFANSIVSPALEFKTEGYITGTAAKMFTIAGPVIVFGVGSSVVYGILLVLFGVG